MIFLSAFIRACSLSSTNASDELATDKAFRVRVVGSGKYIGSDPRRGHVGACCVDRGCKSVMDIHWPVIGDATVIVLVAVPVDEIDAVRTGILQ
jgi:hypothetical protein